jgi:hypothetical protein
MHVMKRIKSRLVVGYHETRNEPGGGPWQAFVEIGEVIGSINGLDRSGKTRCPPEPSIAAEMVNYLNGGPEYSPPHLNWKWTI